MKAILRSVSRSFYLSIRWLPRPLREPVGLAYLLARTTDTLADTTGIAADFRLTSLRLIGQVIAGEADVAKALAPLREFAAQQTDPAERNLIENFANCISNLTNAAPDDLADIRQLLTTIIRGQELDLERFGDRQGQVSLQSAAELEEYTYLVAGCVGEFWTGLGFRHCPPFAIHPADQMTRLGIDYGKGLQLINVLRDRAADLKAGRDYLPAEETASQPVAEVFGRWLGKAEEGLEAGIEYCASLTNWRLRFATALPALIGARTIALLRAPGAKHSPVKIKVPRPEVRHLLRKAAFATSSPSRLRTFYRTLTTTRAR